MSSKGIELLNEEYLLVKSLQYSVEQDESDETLFYVKSLKHENSNDHKVHINFNRQYLDCDCFTFNKFNIYCRHILAFFESHKNENIMFFNRNLNIRWKKDLTLPEPTLNPTQVKRPRDTNFENLQTYASINACVRLVREKLISLNSEKLKDAVQDITNLVKAIDQSDATVSTQERTKSPEKKKIRLDSNFGHIVTNLKRTGRPRIKKKDRKLNPKPRKLVDKDKKIKINKIVASSSSNSSISSSSSNSLEVMAEIHTGDNPIPIPQPTPHNDGPIILTINEESLLNGEWLSDHEIYQYLRLLKTQFPYVNGLEMPCYYTHVKMYIENKTHDFVRIANNNNTHWLCVAG